jgi:uncharacterized protein (DUF58 family)
MIFDESTLRKLNQLTLAASRVRAGMTKGERRSTKRGTSIEFADYRNYTPGDDLRRLDWNVYARLDRPFIKLLEEEEDLAVHILVDLSGSMDWGEGEMNKLLYAQRLAAALGAIALNGGDQLTISTLRSGSVSAQFGPSRGAQHLVQMLAFLEGLAANGQTNLSSSIHQYNLQTHRSGLVFMLTDLFSPTGVQEGARQLQSKGYEISILHILAPDEISPPLAGDLQLVDIETGQTEEVSLDSGLREIYRNNLKTWQENFQQEFRKKGIRYMKLSTDTAWDKFVLHEMRKEGIVK